MDRPAGTTDDEYIALLEIKLKAFEESPYVDSYMTIFHHISEFNTQLKNKKIDIFLDDDGPFFDRAWKYMSGLPDMHSKMDDIRLRMSPVQQKELDEEKKVRALGIAERSALKEQELSDKRTARKSSSTTTHK